jgi:hypothetical protein
MKTHFLLAFVLLSTLLAAETNRIRFIDSDRNPLSGVIVSDGTRAWLSDATGIVVLPDRPLNRVYHARRQGLLALDFTVANGSQTLVLESRPALLEPVRVTGTIDPSPLSNRTDKRVVAVPPDTAPVEALQSTPGVWTPGTAYPGRESKLSILGHRPRHTLVLIDGIPMNENGEAFDLASIPAGWIEKVEILPVGSGVAGSGEIGGVVNLITRRPNNQRTTGVDESIGSFGLHESRFHFEGVFSPISASLSMTRTVADNDYSFENPFGEPLYQTRANNDYRNFSIDTAIDCPHLSLQVSHRDFERGLPGRINQQAMYDRCRSDGTSSRVRAGLRWGDEALSYGADFLTSQDRTVLDNRLSTNAFNRVYTRTLNRRWDGSTMLSSEWKTFSAELRSGTRIDRYDFLNRKSGVAEEAAFAFDTSTSLRTGGEWELGRSWTGLLNAGGRLDFVRYDRTTLVWEAFPNQHRAREMNLEASLHRSGVWNWQFSATRARTFALPSFYDLFWKGDTQTVGNPDLQAETAHSWHLAGGVSVFNQEARFTWRQDDVSDLIYWYRSVNGWKPGNLDKARLTNCETTVSLAPGFGLSGTFSWVRTFSEDRSEFPGLELTFTPLSVTKAEIRYSGAFGYRVAYIRTGPRWSTRDHLRGALPAYETVDAGIDRTWTLGTWSIKTGIDGINILNSRYMEYDAEPQPGVRWNAHAAVEYTF